LLLKNDWTIPTQGNFKGSPHHITAFQVVDSCGPVPHKTRPARAFAIAENIAKARLRIDN